MYLATFIDDDYDNQYVHLLDEFCENHCVVKRHKATSLLSGLTGFLTNKPITIPYYASRKIKNWVNQIVEQQQISKIVVFSAAMAQFVDQFMHTDKTLFMDFVDVDSDKWRQYAKEKQGVAKWFYNRESRKLEAYEIEIAKAAQYSSFVSEEETRYFKQLMKDKYSLPSNNVFAMRNGVDTDYFDPSIKLDDPFESSQLIVSFTGAMDYLPNIDAVKWFIDHVWPNLVATNPKLVFCIIGSNPTEEVKKLSQHNNVVVTGRVDDVRPYVLYSKVVVAPIQIARGVQNKVLEGLALAKPMVLTSLAAEGIDSVSSDSYIIVDDPVDFGKAILSLIDREASFCDRNRQFVIDNFSWEFELSNLRRKFDE